MKHDLVKHKLTVNDLVKQKTLKINLVGQKMQWYQSETTFALKTFFSGSLVLDFPFHSCDT